MSVPLSSVVLSVLALGCGRVGFGALTDGGMDASDADRETSARDTMPRDTSTLDAVVSDPVVADASDTGMTPACADIDARSMIGVAVISGESTADDDTYFSCGEGPEQLIAWTAPTPGIYRLCASSGTFFPQIGALDSCGGAEIACDMVAPAMEGGRNSSQILGRFHPAAPVLLIVSDAYSDTGGAYTVDIEEVSCAAAQDAGMSLVRVTGSTTGSSRWFRGSCGGASAPEHTIRFEASASGVYEFSTIGSDFDTVLYVREGNCLGAEIACNDDIPGGTGSGMTSIVSTTLTAGDVVFIVVDGGDGAVGAYALNIAYFGGAR